MSLLRLLCIVAYGVLLAKVGLQIHEELKINKFFVTEVPENNQTADTISETDTAAGEDYGDEAGDEGNCDDGDLKSIIESSLAKEKDNLEAARKIEGDASAKFGGRFNAIVSNAEFAYVNWYGKRNCQLRVVNRHTLVWED